MAHRKDGKKCRERLLEAAGEVFAKKGFRDAKIAEICGLAGVNVASVNYHFGSKAALYAETWKQAFEREKIPDSDFSLEKPAEERLRGIIRSLVEKFAGQGRGGRFTSMYLMELANPTGVIDEDWRKLIEPRRRRFLSIIREIAGEEASEETIYFCELSVINQCRGFLILGKSDLEYLLQRPWDPELVEKITDHIVRFSLAGIRSAAGDGR